MPQVQLPLFPVGVTPINDQLAFRVRLLVVLLQDIEMPFARLMHDHGFVPQ